MSGFRVLFAKRDQKQQLVDINEIIRLVLESLSSELKDYQVELRSELLSALPHVHGNGSQLQEVVSNLIVNAIEAMGTTSDRSRVLHVRTELRDRQAVAVSIKDSGPGIGNDRLGRIFTAFVTTKSDGMGLGLAICRMIIESIMAVNLLRRQTARALNGIDELVNECITIPPRPRRDNPSAIDGGG